MSRLNYNLKSLSEALAHINQITRKKSLPPKATTYSSATNEVVPFTHLVHFNNEMNVLKDFILYNATSLTLSNNEPVKALPLIPVPLVDCQNIQVNIWPPEAAKLQLGSFICLNDFGADYLYDPVSSVEKEIMNSLSNISTADCRQTSEVKEMWTKFEHALYTSAYRTVVPLMFKPQLTLLDNSTDNRQMAKCVMNEPIVLMLELRNSLKIGMLLTDVTLLWKFRDNEGSSAEVTNEVSGK